MPQAIVYPGTRPDRVEASTPVAAIGGTSVSLPRARLFPWLVGCTGPNQRTTVVSGPFQTPCVIWEIISNWPQAPSGAGGLSVFYSTDSAGAQTNGPAAKPSGTPLFEPTAFRSAAVSEVDTSAEHLVLIGEGGTVTLPFRFELKRLIDQPGPIFLKVSIQAGAGEVRIRGGITVFEGDSVEQLANFL